MAWIQVRARAPKTLHETIEDHLLELGAVSITFQDGADQPVLEPGVGETPLWDNLVILGLFAADTPSESLRSHLQHVFAPSGQFDIEILEDRVWEREWEKHYQPIQFADNLWICPSWCTPPDPAALNLLLDPGLAFGTGTHPSTAMCLKQLAQQELKDQMTVDYGCGSGILGIAMLKMGASRFVGIDNDPQALVATADNARRNSIASSEFIVVGPEQEDQHLGPACADTLVANILAEPLMMLAPKLVEFLKPGGLLVLAGLIESQVPAVSEHYLPAVELHIADQTDEWVCLIGRKRKH
jgi:ribosomal protein L11 methyltransferase